MFKFKFKGMELEVKEKLNFHEAELYIDLIKDYATYLGYSPLYYKLGKIKAFLDIYTNIKELEKTAELDEIFNEIEEYEKLMRDCSKGINVDQFNFLNDCIEDKVKFEKEILLHKTKLDDVFETLNEMLKDISDNIDFEQIKKMYENFSNLDINKLDQKDLINTIIQNAKTGK